MVYAWVVSLRVVTSSHCVLQCGTSGCVALRVRVAWYAVCQWPHYARALGLGSAPGDPPAGNCVPLSCLAVCCLGLFGFLVFFFFGLFCF